MDFLSELWLFMRVRKKFWLMPIFFMLVTVGGLMVLLTKGSVKTKEWNLLKEEFDALVRNGFPLQGKPVGWPGLPRLHHRLNRQLDLRVRDLAFGLAPVDL